MTLCVLQHCVLPATTPAMEVVASVPVYPPPPRSHSDLRALCIQETDRLGGLSCVDLQTHLSRSFWGTLV